MDKRARNIGILLAVILTVIFVLETLAPRPVVWRYSFTSGDKIPFGAYVLYDQLDELFPDQKVQLVDVAPMKFLDQHQSDSTSNYIFINNYLSFDEAESNQVMEFASRGNKVFVASNGAYGSLTDTLGLESNYVYYGDDGDTIRTRLVNPSFKDRSYVYTKGSSYRYFETYDTLNTTVLGEVLPFEPYDGYFTQFLAPESSELIEETQNDEVEDEEYEEEEIDLEDVLKSNRSTPQVNFVEVKVGKGAIYYSLNPIAFTNYYMLEEGKPQAVAEMLSYLNTGNVYWDDYGKSGRKVIGTPMRYILSQSSLSWAYWVATITVLLFFFFRAKRTQRIIPVVKKLNNATVEFTKTIAHMYYQHGDVSGVLTKKITYFLERLRSTYYLNTTNLNDRFIKQLSIKSGKSMEETQRLITLINTLKQKSFHTQEDLKELNKRVDTFLKK